ncbi:Sec63-domain-containing protein [Mortierella sp. GBAus27b]|nr:Sec63-domain-containing protein [Mortierella sp. GBAus27b]
MADKVAKDQQYQYALNSNLVLQSNRSDNPRRGNEPTGEAESLFGRIDPKDFGNRATRDLSKIDEAKQKKSELSEKDLERRKKKAEEKSLRSAYGYSSVLAATEDLESGGYRPRTKETRHAYELILTFVQRYLGDVSHELVRSAGDTVLQCLHTDTLKDFDKKKEIEEILGPVNSDQFSVLLNLGKKITDYNPGTEEMTVDQDGELKNVGEIDEQYGVAVVFDEEEEEEDIYSLHSESDHEEEDGLDTAQDVVVGAGKVDQDEEEAAMDVDNEEAVRVGASETKVDTTKKLQPHQVDAYWLQRFISTFYKDEIVAQEKTDAAMAIIASETNNMRDCENELMALFDYDKFELVSMLTRNRDVVVWCTRLGKANEQERPEIETKMKEQGLDWIIKGLGHQAGAKSDHRRRGAGQAPTAAGPTAILPKEKGPAPTTAAPRQLLDLEAMTFAQGSHLMSNKRVHVPEGSFRRQKKGYEEVHVPQPKKPTTDRKLKTVGELPEWIQPCFPKGLNQIQSVVYDVAYGSDENMLLCAPTGAGKTNCAMLTVLHEIEKYRDPETGIVDKDSFKIVYIAPMKALVQEMVQNFGARLKPFGLSVQELTGDRQMNKQQIAETQMIVTTPEKWDIITRKATDRSYTNLVRLIIIDEIHLLHDDRGPVLEAIVARSLRYMEQSQELIRLVGLSATLPNYIDVATFLRVDTNRGMFHFDGSWRPCPLKQEFIGITEKKAIKRFQVMNEVTYEKVMEHVTKPEGDQVLIFVHSRKETAKTAQTLRDMALENEAITHFVRPDSLAQEGLLSEAKDASDPALKDLLPYGFGIHHAGMTRADRESVEQMFTEGYIKVLCSTATLAWGVNLPAHTVIIKGTQVYSPEKGRWAELSPQDVLQMLGRAGRPQFDEYGEGIIITAHSELQYYLSLLNQQLPIESQFVSKLADNLNAEIVLGTIKNRDEAVQWLGYTYLYVRMLRNPSLYSISPDDLEDDPYLQKKRVDIVHSAATILDKCNMVKYDKRTGKFQSTELGRIASHYYVSHNSMATYNQHLKPMMSHIELFRVFSLSDEFKYIPVREEEKAELQKWLEQVPVPIKESIEEPTAKINVLLQSYISQLKLEGFALLNDMVYVTQSSGRILRAIFEICLRRGWAQLTRKALDLCKMVEKRQWVSMTPLRQFKAIRPELIKKIERKEFEWVRYFDLSSQELGELVGSPKDGKLLERYVHEFPKMDLQSHVQPLTRSVLKVELTITPDFRWDEKVHGTAEAFWILVEDVDGEMILHQESFILKQQYAEEEHAMSFTVPLFDPLPPNYFVSIISDRWLHSETRFPISFKHLILPEKYPPHTELLDLQPLPVTALRNREFEEIFSQSVTKFNPIQTQVFNTLYTLDDNVFIGAPTGSGKTICAEFAMMRQWNKKPVKGAPKGRIVYIAPHQEVVDARRREWHKKFGDVQGGKTIVALTGETSADLKLLERGDVILATPGQWDIISRRWKQRKNVQTVQLFIADELHLIGGEIGPTYEIVVSRMRYIASQMETKIRIVALSTSLANARDLGEWIGATSHSVFNFHPMVRPLPLDVHIQSYTIPHFASWMIAMAKPTYTAITTHSPEKPVIVFVPSRKQCRLTVAELLTFCAADDTPDRFLHCERDALNTHLEHVQDKSLAESLEHGIGFYHEALSKGDKRVVETLFESGAIQVVVASRDTCWGIPLSSYMVVVMGTQYYDGKDHRYADYPTPDILQMMGRACRPEEDESSRCVLMCQSNRKEFYKKFLFEALPVESHLDHFLHDHFNAEVVTKTIENKQDAVDYLTWTFMYRRMAQNPNYYSLQGVTHRHLSDHLSELVETTVNDLVTSKCIAIEEEMDVSPLNLGMIAAYYNINFSTVELFSSSLTPTTKLKGLLEIISTAAEYESIPIRHHEDQILRRIYDRLPVKLGNIKFTNPHHKANILLQAHFSRTQLPADLASDQAIVVGQVIPLLQACVDVISSNGWLPPALAAMELAQMCVQAMWDRDSPLKQVPYMTAERIKRCEGKGVESVFDLQDMEDEDRTSALQVDEKQMMAIAKFVNRYPSVEVAYEIEDEDEVKTGQPTVIEVQLERDGDEDEVTSVPAPFFPTKKDEGWWVVVGDPATKTLLAIKRVTLQRRLKVKLEFVCPRVGEQTFKLYTMCDSFMGCDQEIDVKLTVGEGEEESDEDEDGDVEME